MKERKTEMIRRELKEHFQIRIAGEETWYPMTVPGSAMDSFARAEVLPDPYYGTNEKQWTEFFRNDFEIQGIFLHLQKNVRRKKSCWFFMELIP